MSPVCSSREEKAPHWDCAMGRESRDTGNESCKAPKRRGPAHPPFLIPACPFAMSHASRKDDDRDTHKFSLSLPDETVHHLVSSSAMPELTGSDVVYHLPTAMQDHAIPMITRAPSSFSSISLQTPSAVAHSIHIESETFNIDFPPNVGRENTFNDIASIIDSFGRSHSTSHVIGNDHDGSLNLTRSLQREQEEEDATEQLITTSNLTDVDVIESCQFKASVLNASDCASKKTVEYMYSDRENCLYTQMGVRVPIAFSADHVPLGARIRLAPVFAEARHINDNVQPCPLHIPMDCQDELARRCFVQVDGGRHEQNAQGQVSLTFPFPQPPGVVLCSFPCFSSCAGGVNRRQIDLHFVLEYGLQVLGRETMRVKVCARPGRDAAMAVAAVTPSAQTKNQTTARTATPMQEQGEERGTKKARKRQLETHLVTVEDGPDDEVYEIQLRGRNLYKIVMTIIRNYEMAQKPRPESSSTSLAAPLFRRCNSLSSDTAIKTWLVSLGFEHYVDRFAQFGFYVLGDLRGRLNRAWLISSLHIAPDDAERILSSYVSWFNVVEASRLSSLESIPEDRAGIRLSRTKVTHSYQMPPLL